MVRNSILDADQVGALCSGTCTAELLSARRQIASACTASTDVIVWSNIVYPATFIVDEYLFTSQVSCFKDRLVQVRIIHLTAIKMLTCAQLDR